MEKCFYTKDKTAGVYICYFINGISKSGNIASYIRGVSRKTVQV
jgi:hypothetical protein